MRSIEPIAKFDLAFSLFCLQHKFAHPASRISKAVSHTGDGHLYAMFGVMAYWFGGLEGKQFLIVGLLAFSIERPIYWLTKNLFKRRRPHELSQLVTTFVTPFDRYSLPSGHTAAAFLIATVVSVFYADVALFAYLWAILIAGSRILLGVHFFTDVVLGALLGIACAHLALSVMGV